MSSLIIEQDGSEVVVPRRRERNSARGLAVVVDKPVEDQLEFLRPLDPQAQARGVTMLLSNARTGMLTAIAAQNLPGIVEFKAKAAAVHEIAKQLQLSTEMQNDAMEFVRRAERAVGVAIRYAQDRGEILRNGEGGGWSQRNANLNLPREKIARKIPGPTDFCSRDDLSKAAYPLTDGVSDKQFEEALAEARAEGNLSRANVVRRVKAKAAGVDYEPPPPPIRPTRKTAGARKVVDDLLVTLNSLVYVINDTDAEEVDPELHQDDWQDMWNATNTIRKFLKLIEVDRHKREETK